MGLERYASLMDCDARRRIACARGDAASFLCNPLLRVGTLLGLVAFSIASPAQQAFASDIVIAVVGPATGANAPRTRAIWDGALAAQKAIDGRGGIKGVSIRLVRRDDRCSAAEAGKIAGELADQRVDLVVGHPCAAAAESAAKIYAARGTIFIATSSRHPGLTSSRAGRTIFRMSGRDDVQAAEAAAFLISHFKNKKIAIVNDRTQFARELADRVAGRIRNAREATPIEAALIGGEKEFPRTVAKIKGADAVFYAGFPLEAGMLYMQLRQSGSRAVMLFSDSIGSPEFTTTFGPDVRDAFVLRARFAIGGDAVNPEEDDERLRAGDHANGSAAIEAYAAAAQLADTLEADRVAIILNGYALETSLGVIRFDAKGDAVRPSYDLLRWTGHSWEGLNGSPLGSLSRETQAQ
jgi:branched-chain amino acid transport system substrate-binding protein